MRTQGSVQGDWVVHKFGGTSVANAEKFRAAAKIVESERKKPGRPGRTAVVVSAMRGVTDGLIDVARQAARHDPAYTDKLESLRRRHEEAATQLAPEVNGRLEADFRDLKEVLRGIWLVGSLSDQALELISGFGEIWSAQLLDGYLRSQGKRSTWLDARKVLVVEPGETSVAVDWKASQSRLDAWVRERGSEEGDTEIIVITGFVASTAEGIPTTLKRNGSDYSASIFGALLSATEIVIWTDVDGVLSADPRLVPEAVVLPELSYQEATELAYFGAKVVHPSTMAPAIQKKIPIWIRNTFHPDFPGTKIHEPSTPQSGGASKMDAPVKGFATVEEVALVNVEGTGMMGVPGISQRLFGALREVGVSVVMISQASSEHSICFVVPASVAELARSTVERAFFAELHHGQIQRVEVREGCSVLAAVGDGMADRPGVAGKFLSALGSTGVSVRAIAQGSSERNISVVIDRSESARALRAVHSGFFLSSHTLSIGIIGTGGIGSTLLTQLRDSVARLKKAHRLDLRVRGIAHSSGMLLDEQGLDLAHWPGKLQTELRESPMKLDLDAFARHVRADHLPHAVLIDCTASDEVASHYPRWLRAGIHVITPNKKGHTGSMQSYRLLKEAAHEAQRYFLYETTVGAALPVINTLRDLIQTGDRVIEIEGVLSGTLSFLFNTFSSERPFSEVVQEAKAKGYTEPDPREDLSGMDVARKLVILAREAGLSIELSDVAVQSLVPMSDAQMLSLLNEARSRGEVLRYVGRISEEGKASVGLKAIPSDHPFARVRGTDNIIAFRTSRYWVQPLIVQGPGAGPEVTAGGVFADLLRLSSYLGASL